MDPLVLIDAIAICMAYEEKELCKIGEVALAVIFDVASIILGSKERVCHWEELVFCFLFFFFKWSSITDVGLLSTFSGLSAAPFLLHC